MASPAEHVRRDGAKVAGAQDRCPAGGRASLVGKRCRRGQESDLTVCRCRVSDEMVRVVVASQKTKFAHERGAQAGGVKRVEAKKELHTPTHTHIELRWLKPFIHAARKPPRHHTRLGRAPWPARSQPGWPAPKRGRWRAPPARGDRACRRARPRCTLRLPARPRSSSDS